MQAAKEVVRHEVRSILRSLPKEHLAGQTEVVHRKFLASSLYQQSMHIALYFSLQRELDTKPLIAAILGALPMPPSLSADGKCCYLPRMVGADLRMLQVAPAEDWRAFPPNALRVREPPGGEGRVDGVAQGRVELIVVPGLAFTSAGVRLGQGKGFYDRFLAQTAAHYAAQGWLRPALVALAYREQVRDTLPTEAHDWAVDHVLHPDAQ